ncbi:cation diffusion facilitator family transporter [Lachnospiraceae bacterium XBB2008]|nr:cation diffusion facilitator family transporter [Lachnospiraceae bacterium XBB2008]
MNVPVEENGNREKVIVKTSVTGIAVNLLLVAFKATVGLLSNSIAIVLDAVNNLSDALSSVITILGAKLAGREADKKHPFGYGRVEYLSSLVISLIVLYAGITSLIESIKKIIHPETPDYSTVTLIIVGVAVFAKIFLGLYVKKTGDRVNSDSLINSGKDALLDSVISAATLIAAFIFIFSGLSLEAYLGAVISLVIIKAGFDMISETVSKLLGEPGDAKLIQDIKATVRTFPEVKGAYDLILHNYGPDTYNGSVHVEVEDTISPDRLDELSREIMVKVYQTHHVILTAIGFYSVNTQDEEVIGLQDEIEKRVMSHEYVKGMHGFHFNKKDNSVRFDVVISFDAPSRQAVFIKVLNDLKDTYPDIDFTPAMDMDYGEII